MKILIIRFSSIGDIILCTPVIRCVKLQLNAEVHFLTASKFSTVLEANPYIDETIVYEGDFKKTLSLLKAQHYDIIIDLHKSRLSRMLTALRFVKTYDFDKLNVRKWLYVHLKINTLPSKHIVDRYFEGLKSLMVVNDGMGLDYFVKEEEVSLDVEGSYDVLVLGAAHFTKRIPVPLSQKIIDHVTCPVVLLGGQDVVDQGAILQLYSSRVVNFIDKTSLNQAAIIMQKSQRVWSGDTGLMHMAAALKKPLTVFWGNTLPAFGMYPYYGEKSKVLYVSKEVTNLDCRPCSKLGYDQCPKGHFKCMLNQKID
jgi:ADP-heptose:LPS heptosyltransferase